MAVEPRRGSTRVYWETQEKEGYVNSPGNYASRFQMSRHCFEQVMYALAFSDNIPTDDPWKPIRPLINGLNAQRQKHVSPENILVVDECMSAWKSREAKYTHDGLPHKPNIARKSEGKGAELKSLADGDSGVLLELVEGSARQRQKQIYSEFGEGTSAILRLVEQYKGTGRTVVADSAFASVKTLVQLEKRLGLYFMGIVKTASVEYPKVYMKKWIDSLPERGAFKIMTNFTDAGKPMYALCWADRKHKMLISNRGTTLAGTDSVRVRHRTIVCNGKLETQRYEKRVPRPEMVELFFSKFSTIDVHDHLRQGSLAIEREWITQTWMHRVFATILGMVVVDAYLAYRYETTGDIASDTTILNFSDFVSQLSYRLIFNDHVMKRSLRSEINSGGMGDPTHTLKAFSDLPQYAETRASGKRAQRQCRICKRKCSFYCTGCSNVQINSFFGVCGPRSQRTCFS